MNTEQTPQETADCPECRGTGKISAQNCSSCGATGQIIVHSHGHAHGSTVHDRIFIPDGSPALPAPPR